MLQLKKIIAVESLTTSLKIDENPTVQTTSSEGNVRLNEAACKLLGVPFGAVKTENKGEAGVRVDFDIIELLVDGEMKRTNVIYLCELGTKDGIKLMSQTGQAGGSLQCSSAKVWNTLQGSVEYLQNYDINAANNVVLQDEVGKGYSAQELVQLGYLNEANEYTSLAQEQGAGIAGEKARIQYVLTYKGKEEKREVVISEEAKAAAKAKRALNKAKKEASKSNDKVVDSKEEITEATEVVNNPFGQL